MIYAPNNRFSVSVEFPDGTTYAKKVSDGVIFAKLIEDILKFFTSGEASFDTNETLAVSLVREAAIKSSVNGGEWIAL